jgi:hypothetical protein
MSSSRPGQSKSFLFYCAVLLVAGSSVVFGLDWTVAPLPPMHETEASVQAAKLAAHLPPSAVRKDKVVTRPSPAQSAARGPQVAAVNPAVNPVRKVTARPSITAPAPEQTVTQPPPESGPPKCDIDACSAAYRSFRASDCTWQPYEGPRRLCDKGTPPKDVAATNPNAAIDDDQQLSDKCDIAACKAAYFTFTPSDCTYQPSNGPRRLCTKGTPPKPAQAAIDPAVAVANAANAANKMDAAKNDQAKPRCDIEACKAAYFTFTPSDCTYQPSNGPRQLCTKGAPSPPAPEAAIDPAVAAANAANAAAKAEQEKQDKARQEQANTDRAKADAATSNQAEPKCDIEACKQAYFTFNPADCTYQPSDGPRRLCTKGTPPKPEAKAEPAVPSPPRAPAPPPVAASAAPAAPPAAKATPNSEQSKQETPGVATAPALKTPPAAAAPVVSDKCDVEACKQAYFTFNPEDCTYQPSGGPRRLCTKGTPPKSEAKAEPAAPSPPLLPVPPAAARPLAPAAAATPNGEQGEQQMPAPERAPAAITPPAADAAPAVSDKCDVDACKQAYFTFNPSDCTYQPSNGPRRLCTKGTPKTPRAAAPAAGRPSTRVAPNHIMPPGLVPAGR